MAIILILGIVKIRDAFGFYKKFVNNDIDIFFIVANVNIGFVIECWNFLCLQYLERLKAAF